MVHAADEGRDVRMDLRLVGSATGGRGAAQAKAGLAALQVQRPGVDEGSYH
jgi:hypothetical protein